eukprot:gnl/Spiro4/20914_TR10179_c0_g1_i1.p1 gnl/Spiro4/20914_TR10179_c0_g1~~gnl/Spiro4/20914_TR10179_c0_g1_i1.p1  ORF type:complete len:119 (+),score=12.80 gnl/Spiro4/20914_TR10179_c0_g1_i1:117-473(+)
MSAPKKRGRPFSKPKQEQAPPPSLLQPAGTSASNQVKQTKFYAPDDVLFIREVLDTMPFAAPSRDTATRWQTVVENVKKAADALVPPERTCGRSPREVPISLRDAGCSLDRGKPCGVN